MIGFSRVKHYCWFFCQKRRHETTSIVHNYEIWFYELYYTYKWSYLIIIDRMITQTYVCNREYPNRPNLCPKNVLVLAIPMGDHDIQVENHCMFRTYRIWLRRRNIIIIIARRHVTFKIVCTLLLLRLRKSSFRTMAILFSSLSRRIRIIVTFLRSYYI